MTDQEHGELLEVLIKHKGMVLISGYDSELYNDMLKGWYRCEAVAYSQVCTKRKEVLWMNYKDDQMTVLDYMGRQYSEG